MKKLATLLLVMLFGFTLTAAAFAEERATREECVAMCKAAAKLLLENKAAGIAEIANPKGKFVWKDSYVFLMDMDGKMLAHPFKPELTRQGSLLKLTDENRTHPKLLFVEFVYVAKKNGEGWVEYKWYHPVSKQWLPKVAYFEKVDDLIIVSAIYKR